MKNKSVHKISETMRVRLGDVGIFKAMFILEVKKRGFLFSYWKSIDFTPPEIFKNIQDAADHMIRRGKARLADGDISKAI